MKYFITISKRPIHTKVSDHLIIGNGLFFEDLELKNVSISYNEDDKYDEDKEAYITISNENCYTKYCESYRFCPNDIDRDRPYNIVIYNKMCDIIKEWVYPETLPYDIQKDVIKNIYKELLQFKIECSIDSIFEENN